MTTPLLPIAWNRLMSDATSALPGAPTVDEPPRRSWTGRFLIAGELIRRASTVTP